MSGATESTLKSSIVPLLCLISFIVISRVMELYIVKDMVQLVDLKKVWAPNKKGLSRRKPLVQVSADLKFPSMVKPEVNSKSNREFVGKLRDVIKSEYGKADAYSNLNFHLGRYQFQLMGNIVFDINEDCEGFYSIFGGPDNHQVYMTLSLGHVATENTPVSPESLFTFTKELDFIDYYPYAFETNVGPEVEELKRLWDHQTGYIYVKMTVELILSEHAVRTVKRNGELVEYLTEIEVMTRKMLEEEICTDLEIICGDGGIVKGHKGVLGGRSKVFQNMFQGEKWREAKMGQLEMEEMSEQSVRAFLRWIYWKGEKEPLDESDVAVDMLIAGDKYDLEGLVGKMKEIIMERRGGDEMWFSVESAVKLFRWARDLEGLKEFKEKAVNVLKFFEKTRPKKLAKSEDYQELIKNDGSANTAMEIHEDNQLV